MPFILGRAGESNRHPQLKFVNYDAKTNERLLYKIHQSSGIFSRNPYDVNDPFQGIKGVLKEILDLTNEKCERERNRTILSAKCEPYRLI